MFRQSPSTTAETQRKREEAENEDGGRLGDYDYDFSFQPVERALGLCLQQLSQSPEQDLAWAPLRDVLDAWSKNGIAQKDYDALSVAEENPFQVYLSSRGSCYLPEVSAIVEYLKTHSTKDHPGNTADSEFSMLLRDSAADTREPEASGCSGKPSEKSGVKDYTEFVIKSEETSLYKAFARSDLQTLQSVIRNANAKGSREYYSLEPPNSMWNS
ncbi:hypothetical protein QFC19_002735 [Naganishia cerealis]|uniref:Uncharacterized protein n=1 Tax=Naganishia cerealis TaxID=610337 RepID=A0ACC2W7T9_9TREE|nr:hypothetical protein QFC19_002735 [Naganishia cerealis]